MGIFGSGTGSAEIMMGRPVDGTFGVNPVIGQVGLKGVALIRQQNVSEEDMIARIRPLDRTIGQRLLIVFGDALAALDEFRQPA